MKATLSRFTREIPQSVQASGELHALRTSLFLCLEDEAGCGVAEVSPQNGPLNGDASIDEVVKFLMDVALPRFLSVRRRNDDVPHWARVPAMFGTDAASRMASALLEGAAYNMMNQESLGSSVPGIVTGSLLGAPHIPRVSDHVSLVRLKVGTEVAPAAFDALQDLGVAVALDYNGACPDADTVFEHISLASVHTTVAFVEQVVAVGDFNPPLALIDAGVSVSLDESIRTVPDVRNVARYGSASRVCIKPARVGGRAIAKSMINEARDAGLEPYIGGFFETALGRFANASLAGELDLGPSDILIDGRFVSQRDANSVKQQVVERAFETVGVFEVPES